MAWFTLVIAGILEVGWAIGLKYSDGFSKPIPSILTVIGMILSFFMLSISLKTLPVGTAYTIWTGIGAVGTAILGMILFQEPRDTARVICMMLIVAGIIGLKLTS
jgi:quaternary ammonium compound-resistance protein SugE